jgi:cobalt-zinc-cadmium efflux system protein
MSEQHHHPKLTDSGVRLRVLRGGERARLLAVMLLTGATMVAEFVGGLLTGSLALLGDAFHMLTHFLAIALSYVAIRIALRPAPPEQTYRYWRIEVLAGLVNGIWLIPIAGYVVYEAIRRWSRPVDIDATGAFVVGLVGLIVNVVSALLLRRHSEHDVNVRGAFLHMLADSASSVGVLLAAALVHFYDWKQADPLIAGLISVLILVWCVSLLRSSGRILMESVPRHMDLEEIRSTLKSVEGIAEVHDLHVWTITSRMYALTAHVRVRENLRISETEALGQKLQSLLDERYEINHATLQFEVGNGSSLTCEHDHGPAPQAGQGAAEPRSPAPG